MHQPLLRMAVITLMIAVPSLVSERVTAQSPCSAAHCLYLPVIHHTVPVEVITSGVLRGRYGVYAIVGLIRNTSTVPVSAVTLRGTFYDAQTGHVIRGTGGTVLPVTFPGETNPFRISIGPIIPLSAYSIDVAITGVDHSSAVTHRPVTIVAHQESSYEGETQPVLHASGTIRNDQGHTLAGIQAVIYCPNGANWSLSLENIRLAPGATARYDQSFYDGWTCDGVMVRGQGVIAR